MENINTSPTRFVYVCVKEVTYLSGDREVMGMVGFYLRPNYTFPISIEDGQPETIEYTVTIDGRSVTVQLKLSYVV